MNCEKAKSQLSAYMDGQLSEKDAVAIRRHISICSDCSEELLSLYKTSELLDYWESFRAPDGFCEALLAKAEGISHQPHRSIRDAVRPLADPSAFLKVAIYGVAVLVLLLGFFFFVELPLRRSSTVEPLPTITKAHLQPAHNVFQIDESEPEYTTMAEVKTAGIWR